METCYESEQVSTELFHGLHVSGVVELVKTCVFPRNTWITVACWYDWKQQFYEGISC